MATSDGEILELYRISLTNSGSQPAIAEIMDELGYGPEKTGGRPGIATISVAKSKVDLFIS